VMIGIDCVYNYRTITTTTAFKNGLAEMSCGANIYALINIIRYTYL
jgi:hypothetical protein